MGWQTERFPVTPDDELLCGICQGVLQDAAATPCGHTFCIICLKTWLEKATCKVCPHCRTSMKGRDVIPVYSLRQVVNKICIYCENRDRGCTFISRLEDVTRHAGYCGYAFQKCDRCNLTVNRRDLPVHRDVCQNETEYMEKKIDPQNEMLEKRISILEIQLKHTKKKLELCEADNRKLKRELLAAKVDIRSLSSKIDISWGKRVSPLDLSLRVTHFDDVSPQKISELSLLITSSLRVKPLHINVDQVFVRIKHHYEKYARCGTCYEYDVHMLIATAYASNWFSGEQRVLLHHWLENIARYRRYTNLQSEIQYGLSVTLK